MISHEPSLNVPCDECGREATRIKRRYRGKAFCASCYKREFIKALCPKCGMLSRLYRQNPHAVCISCEHKGIPCIRCGKQEYPLGKITEYGPVCNACSIYFRGKKTCDVCGKESYGVAGVSRLGGEQLLCPSCSRSDHAACQACGRHRLLAAAPDGRKLCKKCMEFGETPCTVCGCMMPAGAGKVCTSCYYSKLLHKRTEMNCAAFVQKDVQQHFRSFAGWLGEEVGDHKAAITLNRYVSFFIDVERSWGDVPKEYHLLLKHFGPSGLRKHELPMRYLQSHGLEGIDEVAKHEEAERRRISAIISGQTRCRILMEFHTYLNERLDAGTTSLRSVRLALTPAAKLMQMLQGSGREKPAQKDLTTYLQKSPGQRAAISTFLGFLTKKYGLNLSLPPKDGRAAKKKKRLVLEAELGQLLKSGGSGVLFQRKLLGTALAYFHGLPKKAVNSFQLSELKRAAGGGMDVAVKDVVYWLPEEVWTVFSHEG